MSNQGQQVLIALRRLIANGDLEPGQRLAEIPVSKQLGVSRTPIRLAFRILEQEGLLIKAGARGYAVREISEKEIRDGIDVRGVLEGLAARLVAEKGLAPGDHDGLKECLDIGDTIFKKGHIVEEDIEKFHNININFHEIILTASDNAALNSAISRNDHMPFASVRSLAADIDNLENEYMRLQLAHLQHHIIFDALRAGQGARAEAIMSEHANAAFQYFDLFSTEPDKANRIKLITAAE